MRRMALLLVLVTVPQCARLWAQETPKAIVVPANASRLTDLAARELQRYLYAASGQLLPLSGEFTQSGFVLGGPDESPVVRQMIAAKLLRFDAAALGDQGYTLKTLRYRGQTVTVIAGAKPVGTLYGVYDLLERYGFGFYLGGDALPEKAPLAFLRVNEARTPAVKIRGSLPWYNFLDSPTTWNLADHKRFYDQMAKMRMNFVGFHAYDYEPFAAVKVDKEWRYGQPLQNTAQGVWGTVPMKVAEFGAGTADCFTHEFFGADPSFGYKTPAEGIEKAQALLREALAYARERGVHVCVGFEVGGDPSDPNNERDLELRLKHLVEQYPMIEYVWLWQSEGRGGGGEQAVPRIDTPFGNYYRQVRAQFGYLGDPARVAEAARVSYYALLGRETLRKWAPEMKMIVSGWGGDRWMRFSDFYVGLDKTLPPDVIFAALDNIDPSAAQQVSHAYGELSPSRERWPIPWFESDGGGTRRDQWMPQCNAKPFTYLCRDALKKGCQGLLGIHWRTRGVEEAVSYLAEFGWDPDLTYEQFYDRMAARCFGAVHAAEMGQVLRDLEALGPRWTGARGQVECGGFQWFSDGERPKPENLARLADILRRLVAMRADMPARHLGRLNALIHTIRWCTEFDAAALELQPGGPVERAIAAAEAAKAAGQPDAAQKARAAFDQLRASGLSTAFDDMSQLLITRGDMGSLATANGKAWAAYRAMEQRIQKVLGEPPAPEASPLDDLRLGVTVTPDRLEPGEPLTVRAICRTNKGPADVALHWRPFGANAFASVPAKLVERCTFEAVVPADKLSPPGIEFYFGATDAAQRTTVLPAAGADGPWTTVVLPRHAVTAWAAPTPGSDTIAPDPCTGLTAVNAGPYEIALSWTPGTYGAVRHWEVTRKTGATEEKIATPRVPSHIDLGVRAQTAYTYSVRPVGWAGKVGPAQTATVQTPSYPPPTQPGPVTASPGVKSVSLSWPAGAPGAAKYAIQRTVAGQAPVKVEAAAEDVAGGAVNVWMDDSAPPDVDLVYTVTAISRDGATSAPSAEVRTRAWSKPKPILTLDLNGSIDTPEGIAVRASAPPEFVAAGARRALRFDVGRWLSMDDRPEFDIPSAVTLEAWVKFDALDGIPVLISHARWEQQGYFLQVLGAGVRFHLAFNGATIVLDGGKVETDKWYHVVGTFDGKTARIFLNGEVVGTRALPQGVRPSIVAYHGPLHVGRYEDDGANYNIRGDVCEVQVLSGAKSPEEIKQDFEAGKRALMP